METKILIFEGGKVVANFPQQIENIILSFTVIKPESFWAFYSQEKSDIKEIDTIKAQFKDAEGILDIEKLGAYLKTKPKALEKYCDF